MDCYEDLIFNRTKDSKLLSISDSNVIQAPLI